MNDQLQTELANLLSKTTSAISAGSSFFQTQLPDVIHQLLIWKMVASVIQCATGISILTALTFGLIRLWRWAIKKEEKVSSIDKGDAYFLVSWATFILSVTFGLFGYSRIDFGWLQILLAPKVYLIEYAAHLAGVAR